MTRPLSPETLAAQALGEVDGASGALVPPIHPSTIYEQNPDGSYHDGHAYTRADNPTYEHAERLLATLEGGAACMLLPSGNAAAVAVFQSLLPGDHVLVSRILFWGIRKWLAEFARRRVRRHLGSGRRAAGDPTGPDSACMGGNAQQSDVGGD